MAGETLAQLDPLYFLDYAVFTGAVRQYASKTLEEEFRADPNPLRRRLHLLNLVKEEYAAYEDAGAVLNAFLDYREGRSKSRLPAFSTALHGGSSIYLLDQNILQQLAPDLILTQELCDVCAVSYETVKLAVRGLPGRATILSLEPTTFQGILDTIRQVGEATGTTARAASLVRELEEQAARSKCGRGQLLDIRESSPWNGWIHPSRPAIGSLSSSVAPAAGMTWPAMDVPRPRFLGVGSRTTIPRLLS